MKNLGLIVIGALLAVSITFSAQAQWVTNITGGPDDGKLATEAHAWSYSFQLAPDGSIIFQSGFNTIRKIDKTSGIISTIRPGIVNGGGESILRYGPDGTLYVSGILAIYKFENNAFVHFAGTAPGSVVDGTPAAQARLGSITDFTFDENGDMYVADSGGRICKINMSTLTVTTVAGTGVQGSTGDNGPATSAQINPMGLTVDATGVYFTEFNFRKIRKVNRASGVITTIAGTGVFGDTGDGGQATLATLQGGRLLTIKNNILYISTNTRIRQLDLSTGIISAFIGTSTPGFSGDNGPVGVAQVNGPNGMIFDSNGDVIFNDIGNKRLRKVSGGIITTIAGGVDFITPTGAAVHPNGDIYFSQGNQVKKINPDTRIITTVAGTGALGDTGDGGPAINATFKTAEGVAFAKDGTLLVADFSNGKIRRIDLSSGIITTFAGSGLFTGPYGDGGQAIDARFDQPMGIAVNSDGEVFVSDYFKYNVRKIATNGVISTVAGIGTWGYSGDNGPATLAQITTPGALAIGPDGNLYISTSGTVRMVDNAGIITTYAGNPNASSYYDGPTSVNDLYFDFTRNMSFRNGKLVIPVSNSLGVIDKSTDTFLPILGSSSRYGYGGENGPSKQATAARPTAVIGTNGIFYVVDGSNTTIRKIEFSAQPQTITFNPAPTTFGVEPYELPGTITSGLPIIYSSSDPAIASVNGNVITIKKTGSVDITASHPGDDTYLPAALVVKQLVINKATPIITFDPVDETPAKTTIALTASANGSTGAITFSVENETGSASIINSDLTTISKGTVKLTATITADDNYEATSVTKTLTITKAIPAITITSATTGNVGTTIPIVINKDGSGGAVTISINETSGKATLTGTSLKLVSAGYIDITIAIAEDEDHTAVTKRQTFTINPADGSSLEEQLTVYGATVYGGAGNQGLLFQTDSHLDDMTKLKEFTADPDGYFPNRNALLWGSDGNLYGAVPSSGMGVLFKLNPVTNEYTVLHTFEDATGRYPIGTLVQSGDKIFGITRLGGANNDGTFYEYDLSNGVYTVQRDLLGITGGGISIDGSNIYFATQFESLSAQGTLYRYDTVSGIITVLDSSPDFSIVSGPIRLNDHLIFAFNGGVATFNLNTSIYEFAANFGTNNGSGPQGMPVLASNGKIYITNMSGGTYQMGTILEYDPVAKTCTKKFDFGATTAAPRTPFTGLTLMPDGKLAGTTRIGGANGRGTLFEYVPGSTSVTLMHSFEESTGTSSTSTLGSSPDGKIYGMNNSGGANGVGNIFEFNRATSTYVSKKDFIHAPDGGIPGVFTIYNGSLFGRAGGGQKGAGIIYRFDLTTKTYHKLLDTADKPLGTIEFVKGSDGKLYILTGVGGLNNGATIKEYNPTTSQFDTIYEFKTEDGATPSSFRAGSNGKLYGVANGGAFGRGLIFEFDPITKKMVAAKHLNESGGYYQLNSLTTSPEGMIYGFAIDNTQFGSVYEFNPETRNYKILFIADTLVDKSPFGANIVFNNGKLYGAFRQYTDPTKFGYLWEYDAVQKKFRNLYDLKVPVSFLSSITLSPEGKIWLHQGSQGTDKGSFIEVDPITKEAVTKITFTGPNGWEPVSELVYSKLSQTIQFEEIGIKSPDEFQFRIKATASSMLPVTFKSSNPDVAVVIDDIVTIAGSGETTITAMQPGNLIYEPAQMVSQLLKVVVREDQYIEFSSISEKKLGGPTFELEASASSGLDLTYTATPDGLVTIAGSTVTMIHEGRVTIIASQSGDDSFNPAYDAEQSFCINPKKPVITASGPGLAITLTSSNDNGNQWYKGNTLIEDAFDKTYVSTVAATFTVQSSVDDCISEMSNPFSVVITGLEDHSGMISVYPNPVRDQLFIEVKNMPIVRPTLVITDMLGRNVYAAELSAGANTIEVGNLAKGIYVVKIQGQDIRHTRTFIKQD